MSKRIELYDYREIAKILRVKVNTVRTWKTKGFFSIVGYRRLGKWAKEAVVSGDEVERLIKKVLRPPR